MKYKLTEDGKAIEMKDGKPIVIGDDDKEFTVDAIGANEKVRDAMSEAKKYRKEAKDAKDSLAKFEGIEDPSKAIEALKTVESMTDDHKLEVENLKKALNETWESKIEEKDSEITDLKKSLFKSNVLSKFATSSMAKKLVLPPDIAAEYFGKHFKSDGTAEIDGKVLYSKENPGNPAEFDEALEMLVEMRPDKDALLKGSGVNGSGGYSGGQGGGGEELHGKDAIAAGLKARGIG